MKKGKHYEELACNYLRSIGYKILRRNYHCRFGEIDIIALDGNRLVFVEVKGSKVCDPAERIDKRKMERLKICMEKFLGDVEYQEVSFEVVLFVDDKIEHIRDIFLN